MKEKVKRIGLDARFYGPVGKGLGRYTQEIVDRVIKQDTYNQYVVFLSQENFDSFYCSNKKVKKILIKARWYSVAEQIVFPFIIWRQKLDLMHFMHFNVPIFTPVKFLVTIHDLILTKFPTTRASTLSPFFYKIKNLAYKIVIWIAIKRAKSIIAVSKFTRNDIIRQFNARKDKVKLIYEGVSDFKNLEKENSKNILNKYNIKKPFLLYVGNAYPHKNLERLIKAFLILKKDFINLSLVLVGKEDYFYKRLKNFLDYKKYNILFPGFVADDELGVFFQEAECYVFPSLYEGFGLPPLEAMAFSCPVVSSNRSCLPEILGDAAVYFNPEKEQDIVNKIKKVIKDDVLKKQMIAKGSQQIKKYSWQKAVEQTLKLYHQV